MIQRVGIIGLGKMGLPMTRHMLTKGFSVAAFDIAGDRVALAESLGAEAASFPAETAKDSDLIIVIVGFDSEVMDALTGPRGVLAGAPAGAVIAIASTVLPGLMQVIEAEAIKTGIRVIDTPLCRSEHAAQAGKLLMLGGGDADLFELCRPAFASFCSDICHLGPLGSGQVGKMINNLLLWACIAANYEGLKLGAAMGVEPGKLRDALLKSSGANWPLENYLVGPMPWAEKDMTIVAHEADRLRLSLPLCGVVKEVVKHIKVERGLETPASTTKHA